MSTLLTYAINTTPNMLTEGTSDAVLILMATNNGTNAVNIAAISFTIPTGTHDNELTEYPSQIQQSIPDGWKVDPNLSPGNISFVLTPSQQSIAAGSSVSFTFSKINVNANQGTVELIVTEGSTGNPTFQIPVSKFPAGWGIVDFSTKPSNLTAPGKVTLKWYCSAGATYTIQYMDTVTGQIYNLPAPGDPVFSNSGIYPGVSDPPLIISTTTFFTFAVTATIGGNIYQSQVTLPVSVYIPPPPPPVITSFSGSMGTSLGGDRVLNLVWTSTNAHHVVGDWTTDLQEQNVYPSNPKQIFPPFRQSYSVMAVTGTETSPPKTVDMQWQALPPVAVGVYPVNIILTPDNSKAFVSIMQANTVAVIDTVKLQLIATVYLRGERPSLISIIPNGQYVFVCNLDDQNLLSIIDVQFLTVSASISFHGAINYMVVTPDSNYVILGVQSGGATIEFLNVESLFISSVIAGTGAPRAAAITNDGKYVLTINENENTVWIIDVSTVAIVGTVEVQNGPANIAITSDNQFAYVTNMGSNSVSVINIQQTAVVNTINAGYWPTQIAITPDGTYAVIVNSYNNTISILNIKEPSAPVQNFDPGDTIQSLLISPDSSRVFIVVSGSVVVYNLQNSNSEGSTAIGINSNGGSAITSDGQHIFVPSQGNNNVSVLELGIGS